MVPFHIDPIRLSPEDAELLSAQIKNWAIDATCAPQAKSSATVCLNAGEVEKEVNRIFQDNQVHPLEAPVLYNELHVFTCGTHRLLGYKWEDAFETFDPKRIPKISHTRGFAKVLVPFEKHLLALFQPAEAVNQALNNTLSRIVDSLDDFILQTGKQLEALKDQESSSLKGYLNFVSFENLWGLSAFMTEDGSTFSSQELKATERLLARLQEIRSGALIFQKKYERGILEIEHPFVRTFLESPFFPVKYAAYFDHDTDVNAWSKPPAVDEEDFYGPAREFVRMSNSFGAKRFAIQLSETLPQKYKGISPNLSFASEAPQGWERAKHTYVRTIANTFLSLDSLACMAVGGLGGRLLAKAAMSAQFLQRARQSLGVAYYLMPGASPFSSVPGQTFWAGAARLAGTVLFEAGKFTAATQTARATLGEEAADWTGRAFLTAASANAAFNRGLFVQMADDLAQGVKNPLLEKLSAANESREQIARLSDEIMRASRRWTFGSGNARLKTDNVVKAITDLRKEAAKNAEAALAAAERLAEQATGISAQIAQNVTAIRKIAEGKPGLIVESVLQEVKELAGKSSQEALKRLRAIASEAASAQRRSLEREAAAAAPRPASPPPSGPKKTRVARERPSTPPAGKSPAPKAEPQPRPSTPPRTAAPLSPLELALREAPETIDEAVLQQLTKGRMSFTREGLETLEEFYRNQPQSRTTVWRRISEMLDNRINHNLKVDKDDKTRFFGRVADYRLFFEKAPDGTYRILRIIPRGSTGWSEW